MIKYAATYAIYGALAILILLFSALSDAFLTLDNAFNILRQVCIIGISAVGMTFVVLTGGIDLAVGSMIGVAGMLAATLFAMGVDPALAVMATLLFGALMGVATGAIINEVAIPPLIATLGVMTILRGAAYVISDGLPIYGIPSSVKFLGQGHVAGIPVPVVGMALVMGIGYVLLTHTVFGRQVYGTGGNEEASHFSGVSVRSVKYKVYLIEFVLASVAGIVLMARVNSAQPRAGMNYELDVITAVVLGGVSIMGGVGRLSGVIAGVLIMGVLANGMILLGVDEYMQWIVKGFVLLAAVALDRIAHTRYERVSDERKFKYT